MPLPKMKIQKDGLSEQQERLCVETKPQVRVVVAAPFRTAPSCKQPNIPSPAEQANTLLQIHETSSGGRQGDELPAPSSRGEAHSHDVGRKEPA